MADARGVVDVAGPEEARRLLAGVINLVGDAAGGLQVLARIVLAAVAGLGSAEIQGLRTGVGRVPAGTDAVGVEAVAAARLATGELSQRARANLLRSLGHICWWYGDPEATLRYCQEALTLVSPESPIAASVYITMATPYVYRQKYETARQYAEHGLAIAEQLQLPELLPSAHSNLGSILTRGGDMEAGERHLRRAVELAQGSGLESYARVMSVGYLAQNLCGQARLDEARQLAEAILWERAANPNTYEMVVTRSVLADIALESNELDEAQAIFESLEEIGERRQFRIPLAMVYFGLAYIHQQNGRSDSAIHYAKQSVAILDPLDLWQLFLDQGERARVVCQVLIEAGEATPFVDEVMHRLPGSVALDEARAETAVSIQCLGEFRVFIGGEEVTQEQWVSTKARDMLAYFVTHRQKHIPLEKAAADIWPDQDQPGRAFHSALYRLRHALRRGDEKTKFINVKSGEYWLDSSQFKIDVDEFETAVAAASRSTKSEAAILRDKAITLYGGDYMQNLLYYDWANIERRRLEEKFLQLLVETAEDQAQSQNYLAAIDLINQAIERDVLRENLYCRAMDYYVAMGNRSDLIRCYQTLTEELITTLSLPPSPHTQQYYQQLLSRI